MIPSPRHRPLRPLVGAAVGRGVALAHFGGVARVGAQHGGVVAFALPEVARLAPTDREVVVGDGFRSGRGFGVLHDFVPRGARGR